MRILHFSDVHLSKDKKSAVEMLVGKMIESLTKELASGEKPIDIVVFTGDFLDKAGFDKDGECYSTLTEGLEDFRQIVIAPLMKCLNLPEERFLMSMGNHEVVRKAVTEQAVGIITDNKRPDKFNDLYWHITSKESVPWLMEYRQFEKELYKNVDIERDSLGTYQTIEVNGTTVCVTSISSTWATFTDEEYVHIHKNQIKNAEKYLQKNLSEINILIAHNHYNDMLLEYRNELEERITSLFQMCFVGHTHSGNNKIVETSEGNTYFSISPSFNKENIAAKDDNYKNGFVIVDYDVRGELIRTSWYILNDNYEFVLKHDYGENGISEMSKPRKYYFSCISNFLAEAEPNPLLSWPRMAELKNILNAGDRIIRLTALPGFGKTRLIRESFLTLLQTKGDVRNILYCANGKDDRVYDELEARVRQTGSTPLTFVIDDCQRDIMERCVRFVNKLAKPIRLIVVDNNPYGDVDFPGCRNLLVLPDEVRETVDSYIAQQIPVPHGDDRIVKEIQMLADGFPYMAILLVDAYKENGSVALRDIQFLIDKMLKSGPEEKAKQEGVMKALSLFQPMPTEVENEDAYEYVVANKAISHLGDVNDIFSRRGIFSETLSKYHSTLVENTGYWINVRPFPLAVWLVSKWFDEMSIKDIEQLITDIQGQDPRVKDTLKEGMCQRIGQMQESRSAQRTIDKLNSVPNGSFCSEKVVCSDMGSRLFLAMSTVNPEKVAKCLRYLFSNKDGEWIRANVVGDTRRSLVQALNKLCFAHESFDDAIIVMAQFASAENEHWANNSMGGLKQIFPILLPDTEVSLKKRVETIELLWKMGYKQEALSAINVALRNNSFSRMCGAEKFGWHHREAYHPKTNREIWEYWDGCISLLKQWYTEDEQIWVNIQNIVESHVYDWRSFNRMEQYLFPLMDIVLPHLDGEWQKLYDDLLRQTKHLEPNLYTDEQKHWIDEQLERLRPKHFVDDLFYANRRVYDNLDKDKVPFEVRAHQIMHLFVKRFIDERIYENAEELVFLASKNVSDGLFVRELGVAISDEALSILCANLFDIIKLQGDSAPLYFTNSVLMVFKDKPQVHDLIVDIYEEKLFSVYVRALAIMENDDLISYHTLLERIDAGGLSDTYVDLYLNSLWGATHQQLHKLLPSLLDKFPDKIECVLDFVTRHRFGTGLMDADMQDTVRRLLLEHPFVNAEHYVNVEYLSLLEEYLDEHTADLDFAKQINLKVLNAYQEAMVHNYSECKLYEHLLQEPYQSAIWNDFTKAFEGDKGVLVFLQLQYEIGSGFTFGAGPLFKYVSADRLKEWGRGSKQVRHYLANMAPVFHYEDGRQQSRFSDFIMWLLDEYGNDEEVISGVSSNINTYSWVGSQYELHEDMIKTYETLLNHHKPRVREWAEREIAFCEKSIEQERSRDDYMRMHYS